MRKPSIAVIAALVAAFGLAACDNTIRGAGKDVKETGDAIADTAQ